MAIAKKKETEEQKYTYDVEVKRAIDVTKDGGKRTVMFDLIVNGITIYGMVYREYTNKEGKDGSLLSFPSQKGKDGNYYNHCWFPISSELKATIEELVGGAL